MGLLDRFRPQSGLSSPDAETRLAAVQQLPVADLALLEAVVTGDADPRVRRAAVRRARDLRLLAAAARADADGGVREAAAAALLGFALQANDETTAHQALEGLGEARHLGTAARSAGLESVARRALERITEPRALASIARHATHAPVRREALRRLEDEREIAAVALRGEDRDLALEAVERVSDPAVLADIAARARHRAAARAARERLRARTGETAAEDAPRPTDREAQMRFIDAAESLAGAEDWDEIPARLAALQDAWIEEIPAVDDDLDERFRAACLLARRRHEAGQSERVERERRERDRHERLAPRLRLCEEAEAAADEASVERARAAWASLLPVEGEEAAAVEARFEAALRASLERAARETETRRAAEEESRKRRETVEAEALRRANLTRLERQCAQFEKLTAAASPALGKLERGLREVRAALQTPPPLPTQHDHDAVVHRLRQIQTDLVPKIQALRDTDRWQRWANAAVQEELCALMEDLARSAEEEGADLATATKGLRDLMERWRAAGPAPADRSLTLWERFKSARDRVRARCDVFYKEQDQERERNLEAKRALCERAETLQESNDWAKTADAIRGLQNEWKGIGPASRGHEKEIWERFRKACDLFFSRREADLAKRKDEWDRNLQAKTALCERAEILAQSTEWRSAAAEIKKLQADWKTIGPVKRSQSEAIWKRFRGACDQFFERFKNRDAVEREALASERAALCAEVESLHAPADAAPAAEEMVGRLRAALERWRRMRILPPEQAEPLNARFFGAFDRVLSAHPQAFQGTSLDAEANRKRMEDLVRRLEKAAPAGGGPDVSAMSPAERLASQWREALAANTMGARVADETRSRAAAEEVKRAQAAWQRLGYVPETERRLLQERFDKACRRLLGPSHRAQATVGAAQQATRG